MKGSTVRLGNVLALERIPVEINADKEYTQIGIRSFGKGIFHRDPALGSTFGKLRYFEVHPGRLIVSNIMAWEGAIALSSSRDVGCVGSNRFLSYAAIGKVDLAYLNYFFQSDSGRKMITNTSTGTVLRNQTLSMKDFESLVVPLPEIDEQRRIATKLDALLTKLDTAGDLAENVDFSRLTHLAVSALDSVLAKWQDGTVRIDKLCSTSNDLVRPGDDPGSAKEFVGLEHIAPHVGERIGSRPVSDEKGRKFRFAPGDVVYGYLRPYLNKVWVADRHGLCSVEQYVLRPNGRMPAELIAAGLRSRETLDKVLVLTNNLQLPRLRSGLLMSLEIPDIPECNHESATADVASFMRRIRHYRALQHGRSGLLINLRPSILNAAFAGQL